MNQESRDGLVETLKAECDGEARKVWPLLPAPFIHIGTDGARVDVDNLHGVIVSGHPNAGRALLSCLSALAGDPKDLSAWRTFEWFAKGVAAEAGYTGPEGEPDQLGQHIRELRQDAEKWRALRTIKPALANNLLAKAAALAHEAAIPVSKLKELMNSGSFLSFAQLWDVIKEAEAAAKESTNV